VDPKWIAKSGGHDDEVRLDIYRDCLGYLAKLKAKGYLQDMGMLEFARWYRQNRGYNKPDISLWQDIIFGSEKQAFWYIDAWMRATVDPNQGGAVVDLRPYVSRLHRPVGADTEILYDGSYPYILHAQYRGGWPCFMDTKSMFTGAITCRGRTVLLNHQRTQCDFRKEGGDYLAIMNPVELDFGDLTAACMTKVVFRGAGAIEMQRTIACAVPDCEFEVLDFLNGTCGTTEYPTDMRSVILGYAGAQGENRLKFAYTGRSIEVPEVDQVYACVPDAGTRIVLSPGRKPAAGLVRDGIVTGPMYTLGIRNKVKAGGGIQDMPDDFGHVMHWSCPWCFARQNDSAGLVYDKKKGEYYCVRCYFTGDRAKNRGGVWQLSKEISADADKIEDPGRDGVKCLG